MTHVIGRGRYGRETYPPTPRPARSGSLSAGASLVYREGETMPGGNVFAHLPDAVAAANALNGAATSIYVDPSLGAPVMPPVEGGYDFTGIRFWSPIEQATVLTVEDGVVITSIWDSFEQLGLSSNASSPIYTYPADGNANVSLGPHATCVSNTAAAVFAAPENGGGAATIWPNTIVGDENRPVFEAAVGAGIGITVDSNSQILDQALSGAGAIGVEQYASALGTGVSQSVASLEVLVLTNDINDLNKGMTTPTTTLSSVETGYGYIIPTGALTGDATLVFTVSPAFGQKWTLDVTELTFNGHTLFLEANGHVWGTPITGDVDLYLLTFNENNGKLYGTPLTP